MRDDDPDTERATGRRADEQTANPVDLSGQTLADFYLIRRRLGSGGMGIVYLACDIRTNENVAIKCVHPGMAPNDSSIRRFLQETQAASQIRHANIVHVIESGRIADGLPYIVMEYLDGEDLSTLVQREGALPWRRVAHIIVQVADALAAAHRIGIVHRDIKPANCFIQKRKDAEDHIKVLDFGLAKLAPELRDHDESLTSTGVIMGTPGYIAPEVYRGFHADARSDIYALGVLAYRLIEDELPPFRIPDSALNRAPSALRAIILRCLSHDPEDRYPDAYQLREAVKRLLDVAMDGPTALSSDASAAVLPVANLATEATGLEEHRSPRTLLRGLAYVGGLGATAAILVVTANYLSPLDPIETPVQVPELMGSLKLEIDPPDARISIDGSSVDGSGSPRVVDGLSPKTHRIMGDGGDAYLPWEQDVEISAGQTLRVPVKLDRRNVTIVVDTEPSDVTLKLVDGTTLPTLLGTGNLSFLLRRDPSTKYRVIGERPGYTTAESPISFSGNSQEYMNIKLVNASQDGSTAPIEPPMQPVVRAKKPKSPQVLPSAEKTAELKIGSAPGLPPATIWVDGELQPRPTPISVMVAPDIHIIKWKYPDGRLAIKEITVGENTSQIIKGIVFSDPPISTDSATPTNAHDLLERLEPFDQRRALRVLADDVAQCRTLNNVPKGAVAVIEITVDGRTGLVLDAREVDTSVAGPCLAKLVRAKGTFPRFNQQRQTFNYRFVF